MKSSAALWIIALVLTLASTATAQPAAPVGPIAMLDVRSDETASLPLTGVRATGRADEQQSPVDELLVRLGEKAEDFGARVAVHDSGFDPRTDSPAFRNFKSWIGPDGDCMGMSFVTKQVFLKVDWTGHSRHDAACHLKEFRNSLIEAFKNPLTRHRLPVCGFPNFKAASQDPKIADALHQLMALGQIRNLHPEALHSVLPQRTWDGEHAKLNRYLDRGIPSILALTNPFKLGGHAVLAYKVVEYQKKSIVFVYDCNAGPSSPTDATTYQEGPQDTTYRTLLVFDKQSRKVTFHKAYDSLFGYAYSTVTVYEGPDLKALPREIVEFVTQKLPKKLHYLLPTTPLERAGQLFSRAHELIRKHVGLPF